MSYTKCYWGQFIILDLDYITYFSNSFDYVYGVPSPTASTRSTSDYNDYRIEKYNSMKNKLKPTTSYKELNTLQIIYETQFDFDEEMSNPKTITELDTLERVVAEGKLLRLPPTEFPRSPAPSASARSTFGFGSLHQISRPIIMILCMTAVSLYIIL